jgi:hypothetical protein
MRIARVISVWLAALVATPAWAERVALLQIEAPGLLPAARERLEEEVRAGVADGGLEVQDGDVTRGFVADAVTAGLACSLADEVCALKVAVAADVDGVIVGRVVAVGGRSAVELRLIGLDGKRRGIAGSDPARLVGKRLVVPGVATEVPVPVVLEPPDAALDVDGAPEQLSGGFLWLQPGVHHLVARAAGTDVKELDLDVPGDRLLEPTTIALEKSFPLMTGVGLVAAGGGVVVAGIAGLFAFAIESSLAEGVPRQDLEGTRGAGQVVVVIGGLGLATALGGGALAVIGLAE